jgi:hypothetical protein
VGPVGGTNSQQQVQGAPKKKEKKHDVPTSLPKKKKNEIFWSDFRKHFMVFLGSSCRETAKNAIKNKSMGKDDRKKKKSQLFRPKVFDMDFPQNVFYGVFELPLLRNAQKRHKKNSKKNIFVLKKGTYLPHLVAICQIYVISLFICLVMCLCTLDTRSRPGPKNLLSYLLTSLGGTAKNAIKIKIKRRRGGNDIQKGFSWCF